MLTLKNNKSVVTHWSNQFVHVEFLFVIPYKQRQFIEQSVNTF